MKIVVLVLGLALAAFAAKTALEGTVSSRSEHTAPRRQLDQVREKAHDLELQQQEAVDKAAAQAELK